MSEYTDLIREARERTESMVKLNLVDRLADALEASEARRVEAGAAALEVWAAECDDTYIRIKALARAAALRSALEGEHTEPNRDPMPWFNGQATPQRSDHERYWDVFDPRPKFSQDPAHYPGGTE